MNVLSPFVDHFLHRPGITWEPIIEPQNVAQVYFWQVPVGDQSTLAPNPECQRGPILSLYL